jgi:diguanylate cyclase (GGDEF)-like protein
MLSSEAVKALAALARMATGEFTIDELLHDLCTVAARALDVDGAGVMIKEPGGSLRFIHAAPERFVDVESLQQVLQRGPCLESMRERKALVLEDITTTSRWPEFAGASATAGVRAVVAMPLLARGEAWGSLDVYRNTAYAWTEEEIEAVSLFTGIAAAYLVMAADRDLARVTQRDTEHLATHDELTGLPGRVLLYRLLEKALVSAGRRGTAVAVFFIDLDRFKDINDVLGHAAGDEVLTEVAGRLARALRGNDILARLSGDEFVAVCEDLPCDPAELDRQLHALGHRLDTVLSRPMHVAGSNLVVSASIGVAVTSDHQNAQELIGDADSAMYQAKERSRGRLVVGGRDTHSQLGAGRNLEREIEHALERSELRVYYQPIVAADRQHSVVAVEALLRWEHPQHGLLTAGAFINLAERSGAIGAIGRWVIDQACAQLAAWQRQLGELAPQRVFVNLSPREISDASLDAALAAALDTHGVAATDLGLEIVEYNFTDSLLVPRLAEHHDRGHPLAVDDFGTGYSSLARLIDSPVNYAKIDRSFVQGLPHDKRRKTLIEAITVVAHQLGLTVVAEGVETQEQVIDLTAAGCDLLQGYHLGHPQPGPTLTSQWMISARNRDLDMTGNRHYGQHRIPRLVPTQNTESLGASCAGSPKDNGARAGG